MAARRKTTRRRRVKVTIPESTGVTIRQIAQIYSRMAPQIERFGVSGRADAARYQYRLKKLPLRVALWIEVYRIAQTERPVSPKTRLTMARNNLRGYEKELERVKGN